MDEAWDDEEDVEEYDSPDTDDDEPELVDCPECGAEIYEEAEQCPHCGNYVVHSSNPWTGRPTWWLILGIMGLAMTVLALSL